MHNGTINLNQLWVMQDELRHPHSLPAMVSFVHGGGRWTHSAMADYAKNGEEVNPILLVQFPDGIVAIHDGHHRATATFLAGRSQIEADEYEIEPWTYEAYEEIAFERNYVTPHDPRTEVRLPDLFPFKSKAFSLLTNSKDQAVEFILQSKSLYARKRDIWIVPELAHKYESINPVRV